MKPHLLKFERCIFATLVIGVINSALGTPALFETAGSFGGILMAFTIFIQLTTFICLILLVLAISRKNYKFAKVTWYVLFIFGTIYSFSTLNVSFEQITFVGVLTTAMILLQILGTYFLIRGELKN